MNVSVIIACHNAEAYLAQTIASAVDQSRPPHEVVVVDDGSTDGSLALARRFEAALPGRVHVLAECFHRAPRARNLGALFATGDAFLFLDADDVLGPDALEGLTDALAREPAAVAACPWFRLVRDEDRWIQRPASCAARLPGQDPLSAWLSGWYHPPCAVLWSREGFERAGRFDEHATYPDDGDLMMRALALGVPFAEAHTGSAFYRRVPGSLSAARLTRVGAADRIRITRKVAVLLGQSGRLDAYRPALDTAFSQIAADVEGRHPELREQARALARHYGVSRRTRAKRLVRHQIGRAILPARRALERVSRRGHGMRPAEAPRVVAAEEVRCGLDLAAQVLRNEPGPRGGVDAQRIHFVRPSVTIIAPSCQGATLSGPALESALAQTHADFELLIVEDGSRDEDGTASAPCRDPRVRYLREPAGTSVDAARNRGLRESRADLIAFLESDDEWLTEKLARQVALFRAHPEVPGLAHAGVERTDEAMTEAVPCSHGRGDIYREMQQRNVLDGGPSTLMMRRAVVATVGFFPEGPVAAGAYDYWLSVTRFFHVDCVGEPLVRSHRPPDDARSVRPA